MEHRAQLENKKYRNWVRAGLGIKYVKEGLEPFCDHLVNQQHIAILDKVKRKHNLSSVSCGLCDVRTLQPDHVQTKTKQCPVGQMYCNCQHPRGKISCPNKVCSAIYDEIIQLHASTPPAPNWRYTDAQQWCTEPWSIAKCFINAPGYEQKTKANEFDCPGLLHVLLKNIEFQQHIKCVMTGTDVFSRVRISRNGVFHSNSMELEDKDVNCYIDDMIEILEDETEIKHRQESKAAVKKLQELKHEGFIISSTDEAEIRRDAMAAINEKERELEQTIADARDKLKTTADETKHDIEGKGSVIKSELEQTVQNIRKDLVMKEAELEQTGQKIKKELVMKEAELEQTGRKISKGLAMKEAELEQRGHHIKKEFLIKEDESKKKIEQKVIGVEKQLTRKEVEATEKLEQKLQESKLQLESHKNLIENSMTSTAETRKEALTSRIKTDFQKKLVKLYQTHVSKVAPLPRLHKDLKNVSEMFVPPWMTAEVKKEASNERKEVRISMHEIFSNKEGPAKNIYVIGEAGSGKTTFCKMLEHFWCIAHPYQEYSLEVSDIVKEMKNFKFLFYISLRHFSNCDSIENMLKKSYSDPALRDVLQNDSSECLIILDGLDEWNPGSKHSLQFLTTGLPGHELDADYTIITTSRQWKFDTLPISDSEVDKKIKLHGIDEEEIKNLTEKTVETLNYIYQKCKNADKCILDLENRHVSDINHTPLVLQQLICLWFNDKLRDNSKCPIYRSMLDLFLEWKALGTSEVQKLLYVINTTNRKTSMTQYLSYLAYKTLFDKNKETTLTFSSSTLIQLSIPHDVIKDCLASGILKEERNVSLCESTQSSFSFFHKSMQEYLAAVYIASEFKEMLKSQKDGHGLTDVCKKCVGKYFGSCKTVVDILEQSNLLIMLCGLVPQLLTNVSEYIYNVTLVDKMMVEERHKVPESSSNHPELINDIQKCILNCFEEGLSIEKYVNSPVYIADLYIDPSKDLLRYVKNIILKKVLSVEVNELRHYIEYEKYDKEALYHASQFFTNCDQLKAMRLKINCISDEWILNEVATILETDISTLETVSLKSMDNRILTILPKMQQLTSLYVKDFTTVSFPHDVVLSLCKFVNQNTCLKHITLRIDCNCKECDEHILDLSKHKQLQHVDASYCNFYAVSCNTDNLKNCKLNISSDTMMKSLCNSLYKAGKLQYLQLCYYKPTGPEKIEDTTENVIKLLPSLVSFRNLLLQWFAFTDNILARLCDMKNLKYIFLPNVTFSITSWCKFIGSLPALPQIVTVRISGKIIRDGTISRYKVSDIKQNKYAKQYVRKKTHLFRERYCPLFFTFTTKKVCLNISLF